MSRQVVLWRQKAGPPPHGMVCWDYHCFALERDMMDSSATVRVFDLDRCGRDLHSRPCAIFSLHIYVTAAGHGCLNIPDALGVTCFRRGQSRSLHGLLRVP